MPTPWNPRYQAAFADVLAQLSAHLHSTGYYRDVAVIKLTGINTLTEELALPNENPAESRNPNPCVTDSPRIWANAGYRPSLVIRAMRGIAASFQRSFPDKLVNLPIIVLGAFPPIGEDGRPIPRFKAIGLNNKLLDDLVRTATQALRGTWCCRTASSSATCRRTSGPWTSRAPTACRSRGRPTFGSARSARARLAVEKAPASWRSCGTRSRAMRSPSLTCSTTACIPRAGQDPAGTRCSSRCSRRTSSNFPGAIKAAHDEWKR